MTDGNRFPLSGIRVLDFTHVLAGPFCTRLLADFGADVVKVETQARPDRLGATLPSPDFQGRRDRTGNFLSFNRNKRSIAINLKAQAGLALAQRLGRVADIIVENFSAGVLDRQGLGFAALSAENPGLIYVSMSGFGNTGPRKNARSMNMTLQAYSGMMMTNGKEGQPPLSIANSWNDFIGGFHACLAALTGLAERARNGKGRHIDLSQFECSVSSLGPLVLAGAANRTVPRRIGNRSPTAAPQGVYRCKGEDAWCALSVRSTAHWKALVKLAGFVDYEADSTLERFIQRHRRHDEIDKRISDWMQGLTATEAESLLIGAGVPAQRMWKADDVLKAGMERGVFRTLNDPPGYSTVVGGLPFRFTSALPDAQRAPYLGEHSRSVVQEWLGLSPDAVESLAEIDAFEKVSA